MSNLPFAHPNELKNTYLPLPDRITTAALLQPLDFNAAGPLSDGLKGYRTLYGFNKVACHATQGFLTLAQHRIHVHMLWPRQPSQGTVWLIHGYLEHSGIYQPIIKEILEQGFSIVTFDLPGHGLSSGDVASIQDFKVYQDILNELAEWVQAQPTDVLPKPWLGIGQSTGGAIWLEHLLRNSAHRKPILIERALLLSPLVRPARSAWWHNTLGLSLISRIKRDVPRAFRRNNHNPEFLRFVRTLDPLQSRTMSMQWIIALSRWIPAMEQLPAARIPVWVAQGALDETVDWRFNIEFIRQKCRLQMLLLLEEGSHQLINECRDIRAPLTALIPAFLTLDRSA